MFGVEVGYQLWVGGGSRGEDIMRKKRSRVDRQTPRNEISVESHPCIDIALMSIFSYLPKKTLYMLKSVSKRWCRLISNLPCMAQRATDAGFVLQMFSHPSSAMRWHLYGANANRGVVVSSKTVNFKPGLSPWVLDSCHGVILCSLTARAGNERHLCVYNPNSGQRELLPLLPATVAANKLPPPPTGVQRNKLTGYGLVVHVPHFEVVQFSILRGRMIVVELEIFSSETRQWKEQTPVLLCPSSIPKENFTLKRSTIYFNGTLHWIWGGTVLIYNLKNNYFKFVELPKSSSSNVEGTFAKCLWASEGHLHYCHAGYNGICIWVLVKNGYTNHNWGGIEWQVKHSIDMPTLKSQNPQVFLRMERRTPSKLRFLEPFAFNDDMQILYLRVFHTLFCYSIEKGRLEEALLLPLNDGVYYDMYPFEIRRNISETTEATKMGCKLEEKKPK